MNKKIISIVAIIMLVAVLSIALVACNAENYEKRLEKAGYTVKAEEAPEDEEDIKFVVSGMKGLSDGVIVIGYKSIKAAKAAENGDVVQMLKATLDYLPGDVVVERQSSVLFIGTAQGIKDAK